MQIGMTTDCKGRTKVRPFSFRCLSARVGVAIGLVCGLAFSAHLEARVDDPEVGDEVEAYFGPGGTGAFRAQNGIVACGSPEAAMAGLQVLKSGGNAVDAAVAVQFALMVSEAFGSGIGGGLFAVGYDARTGSVYALDGREEAPSTLSADAFRDEAGKVIPFRQRATGGRAVGVPGTLAACALLLKDHGTMTLAPALAPAIRLAREGVPITDIFAANLAAQWDRVSQFPESVRIYGDSEGKPLKAGALFRNEDLARTFEMIAEKGPDFFYRGPLAREIVAAVGPGRISTEDLAGYRPVYRQPLRSTFRDYEIFGMPMPSSGGTTLAMMLGLLDEVDYPEDPALTTDRLSRFIGVQNVAFADRDRFMADGDFADVPVAGMLDSTYIKQRAELIKSGEALKTPLPPGNPESADTESSSTTHFTVVDRHRNLIAITSTIEQHFGSGITVPGRGFLLNNQLTDFDPNPEIAPGISSPNAPEGRRAPRRTALGEAATSLGGKRPRSSMTPTIVMRDGKPVLTLGSPGGSRIIGIVFNVLVNTLIHGMDIQEAVNTPRLISRNGRPEVESPGFAEARKTGINLEDSKAAGAVQAIYLSDDGWLYGAADPRREGVVLGY